MGHFEQIHEPPNIPPNVSLPIKSVSTCKKDKLKACKVSEAEAMNEEGGALAKWVAATSAAAATQVLLE